VPLTSGANAGQWAPISTGGDDASASKRAPLCYGGRRSRNATGRSVGGAGTGQNILFAGALPSIATDLIRLVILIVFPVIALWLPSRM
jgi:hypothetical protein